MRLLHPTRAALALSCLGLALGLYFAGTAAAQDETAEEKGLAIAVEADRRDRGFGDHAAVLRMVLTNRHGDQSVRELEISTLEVLEDGLGDKTLVVFDTPRDVRGTALLTFSKVLEPDDQWLYLPALKRVKRISSVNKSGSFQGSEFAYEDMSSREVGKYSYRFLRDEPCGELTCFVVEQTPLYQHSGYTRLISWIDHGEYRIRKVEYYDRRNALLKTLTASDYHQYLDRYWRALSLVMVNHQSGKTTELAWQEFRFRAGLDENDFTQNSLKRNR